MTAVVEQKAAEVLPPTQPNTDVPSDTQAATTIQSPSPPPKRERQPTNPQPLTEATFPTETTPTSVVPQVATLDPNTTFTFNVSNQVTVTQPAPAPEQGMSPAVLWTLIALGIVTVIAII